jgi:hypothetical protein
MSLSALPLVYTNATRAGCCYATEIFKENETITLSKIFVCGKCTNKPDDASTRAANEEAHVF